MQFFSTVDDRNSVSTSVNWWRNGWDQNSVAAFRTRGRASSVRAVSREWVGTLWAVELDHGETRSKECESDEDSDVRVLRGMDLMQDGTGELSENLLDGSERHE